MRAPSKLESSEIRMLAVLSDRTSSLGDLFKEVWLEEDHNRTHRDRGLTEILRVETR